MSAHERQRRAAILPTATPQDATRLLTLLLLHRPGGMTAHPQNEAAGRPCAGPRWYERAPDRQTRRTSQVAGRAADARARPNPKLRGRAKRALLETVWARAVPPRLMRKGRPCDLSARPRGALPLKRCGHAILGAWETPPATELRPSPGFRRSHEGCDGAGAASGRRAGSGLSCSRGGAWDAWCARLCRNGRTEAFPGRLAYSAEGTDLAL